MKNSISLFLIVLTGCLLIGACSPKIVGTWTVKSYKTIDSAQQGVELANIGTMQFNKNGQGEKAIKYTALGITLDDHKPFKYTIYNEKYVFIDGEGSTFNKSWIILSSKNKTQVWASTNGRNAIQILELAKQ